jgi:hypothetical protein
MMFTGGEDETLELLAQGPTLSHYESVYGEAPYYIVDPSTPSALGGVRSDLNPYACSWSYSE